VGKTSLTQKFVNNVFSDKYLTTIGVKIDTAEVGDTKLIVWDVAGRDSLSQINANYLVGAAGIVLVADGTRTETADGLTDIWATVAGQLGDVPAVVALNKSDVAGYKISDELIKRFESNGWNVFLTSAKDGSNVPELFTRLVEKISA